MMYSPKHPVAFSYLIKAGCFLLLITNFFCLNAQTLPTRRYTTRDGLIADRITAITQDHNGFMWIGSLFGLSKYDGNKFTTINLPASQQYKSVTSLLAAENKLYAGFLFGGGLMQYENGRAAAFHITDKRSTSNDISGLYKADTGIFVVNSTNQVFRFMDNNFKYLFSLDASYEFFAIKSIAYEENGRIWLGTTKGLEIIEKGEKIKSLLQDSMISYIRKTPSGIMVVASDQANVIVQLFNYGENDSLKSTILWQTSQLALNPFYSNQSNLFWGIDAKRGLVSISETGVINFLASTVDVQTEIKYLFSDRENNLWLATDPGVLKISNLPVVSYQFKELAAGGAYIVQNNDSSFWITNSKFLYHISNNQISKVQEFRDKNESDYLGILFTDKSGNLWVNGWNKGLWKLKYKEGLLVSKQYFNTYKERQIKINCSTSDDKGNTWVAGINGIFHISDGTIADHFAPQLNNGTNAFITAIVVDESKNIIWAGDNSGGILKISYQPNGKKFIYKLIDHFDEKHGLEDTYIRSLLLDSRNNLWIGTRLGGIYRMNNLDEKNHRLQTMSTASGISCTRVTDIAEEKGKAIWFATCDGVLRYSLINGEWQKYGVSDGLLGAEIFSLTADAKNQEVWSVSSEGITNLKFNTTQNGHPPPLINITGITILGREDSAALISKKEKKLSPDENSIGFVFVAASYTDEKKIRYKYMLAGYDRDWSLPVETNNVNYLSLPFGHYTFKVLAWNGYQWSDKPASYSFYITRPFYKSAWFIALIAGLIAITFYFVRVYRLRQKLKLEKLRLSIARDLHDDIGSALGSINLLSENANRHLVTNQRVEEVSSVFQKIGYSAQTVLDAMDDIIWAINPEKDSLEDLLVRMREFAIPLLEAKNIEFKLNMSVAEDIKPPMELKRNIYLVFKEAIFNIVRHSEATHVTIALLFNSKTFDIKITDNGKGFNVNAISTRNGLKNMRKRAILSGAELQIDSIQGSGTTIRLQGTFR